MNKRRIWFSRIFSMIVVLALLLGSRAKAIDGSDQAAAENASTNFVIDSRRMVHVNKEDATMAGVFVEEGPLKFENCDGIYCLELRDYSEDYFNKEKYTYMEKPGAKRYAYIRIEDGYFEKKLNHQDYFTVKCTDEGETLEGENEDGKAAKVHVLKLSFSENLSESGILGREDAILNASGYVVKFVGDSDFLKESFTMGIYEFKILSSSHEAYQGKKILILCPKDFAGFLEENSLGLELRGIRCYDGMEHQGNRLWSIVSAVTLDYDNVGVETKDDLMEWYGDGVLVDGTGGLRISRPVMVVGIIVLLALGEGCFLVIKKAASKKKKG